MSEEAKRKLLAFVAQMSDYARQRGAVTLVPGDGRWGTRLHELAEEFAVSKDSPMGYQEIADALREAIEAGYYRPGSILPRQDDIASEHNVNIHTVRRAINLLASEGYVRPVRHRGTVVLDRTTSRLEAIGWIISHAEQIEDEWGVGAMETALGALHTLGVTEVEISAAIRKKGRR